MAPVVVIGGGLAGLTCARHLHAAGIPVQVLEASDEVGGRVRTDRVDGFLLDRGFQVLLTAYPDAQRELDYAALDLKPLLPGALIRVDGRFHRVVDPWRRPIEAALNALAPVGSLADKARVARLRRRILSGTLDDLWVRPEQRTRDLLAAEGFSAQMMARFFQPFFGGVLFDPELDTSSRMFEFVWKMFAAGDIAVPALGMQAIPEQLAGSLPAGTVRTGVEVAAVEPGLVRLADGSTISARAVVVATEGPAAAGLLAGDDPGSRAVTCHYFAAPRSPIGEPILVLNGEGPQDGPVNNLCVESDVSPAYAPPGQALVSATVLDGAPDERDGVTAHLRRWFGAQVDGWRHLRSYRVAHALPDRPAPRSPLVRDGLWRCGDWCEQASINGALLSGRKAAEAVLAHLDGASGRQVGR